jgi:hypothetical protein
MNPNISESALVLTAAFLAIVVCFLIAMAFGVPFFIDQLNQLLVNAGTDFEMPIPTQFQK